MQPLKFTYDSLADDCLERLQKLSVAGKDELTPSNSSRKKSDESKLQFPSPTGGRDLYALLKDNYTSDLKLAQLWDQVNAVPDWVDWDQIARGQDVFYRYGSACLTGLAFQSLLGGMGAARVVETLARTGGFSTKVARRRLYETTQHIIQVTDSLESIQPGGKGWISTIRVRLLHAAVRQRILKLEKADPEYFHTPEWGIPINDLDSIATIATFSSTLIWQSLPRQGLFMRQREKEDYIALWRYVAYVIGCPSDHFASTGAARRMMEVLMLYEIAPSETSKVLANNVVASLAYTPPIHATPSMLLASARWLNGHELCDALALPRPSAYYYLLMVGQCLFFMVMVYGQRHSEYLDRRKQVWMRRAFWVMIVESKSGLEGREATYGFKYVPRLGKGTALAGPDDSAMADAQWGIERRNLKTLGWAAVGLIGVAWMGWRVAKGVFAVVFA
jgi:hypothetical protein